MSCSMLLNYIRDTITDNQLTNNYSNMVYAYVSYYLDNSKLDNVNDVIENRKASFLSNYLNHKYK